MKKFLSLFLVFLLTFSLCACSSPSDPAGPGGTGGNLSFTKDRLILTTDDQPMLSNYISGDLASGATFTSSDNTVFQVTAQGATYAHKKGKVTVTATNGSNSDTLDVYVISGTMIKTQTATLPVLADMSVNDIIDYSEIFSFTSSNPSVAKIEDGKVKSLTPGDATITISTTLENNTSFTRTMTVTVKAIELNLSSIELYPAETQALTVKHFGNDGATFESLDSEIATVDGNVVTALKEGSTFIKVTVGLATVQVPVTVNAKVDALSMATPNDDYFNTIGRTFYNNNYLCLYNTATGFEVSFYGTSLSADFIAGTLKTESDYSASAPWLYTTRFAVYVDGATTATATVDIPTNKTTAQTVTLLSGLTQGVHTAKVYKMTEAGYTQAAVSNIDTDGYFRKVSAPERVIAFYGDSITAGCNNLAPGSDVVELMEDCEDGMQTYASFAALSLGASLDVHARTGIGLYNTYGNTVFTQKNYYNKRYCSAVELLFNTSQQAEFDIASLSPDVVVVNLCTNDIWKFGSDIDTTTLKNEMVDFMNALFTAYGNDTPIIFCYNALSTGLADWNSVVANAITTLTNAQKPAYSLALTTHTYGGHPKVENHKTNGTLLENKIKTILGW